MDDRYPGFDSGDHSYYGPHDQEQLRSPRSAGNHRYSSARDYAAAGEFGRYRPSYSDGDGGARAGRRDGWGPRGDYSQRRPRDDARYAEPRGRDAHDDREERGFFDRAGDEIRSWFGDEEAERRRERDLRYDNEASRRSDSHYSSWRGERIAELDRDYDEYRRENARRFHDEFTSWRSERQRQRDGLGRVAEHMDVIGSDGTHVGTVDKVRGDRIVLTKSDPESGGHHHSIPSRWIQSVDDKVTIRKTAEEARSAWKDEERGALFGRDRQDDQSWRTDHNLNRAFPGTY